MPVAELGDGRLLLDLGFRDVEGLVAAYLIPGEGWSLIETGPTTCREALLRGLSEAGVDPFDVRRVFVTHIHLDHAGGVGALAQRLPKATFFAHREGVPHLEHPERLIASARRAWGASADPIWGPIVPVPADRLRPLEGGERFPVDGGVLQVLATPGHARHHVSFLDERSRSVYSGDSAGVHLPGAWRARPAVPPPDLDIELLLTSVDAMAAFAPDRICYTHFGPVADAPGALRQYRATVVEWKEVALRAARERPEPDHLAAALAEHERTEAMAHGGWAAAEERGELVNGYQLAAQGFLRYFQVHGLLPPGTS
jgi:glyoxylase-like metal-dependent hydrolase (beta-lactamase superfamily II)